MKFALVLLGLSVTTFAGVTVTESPPGLYELREADGVTVVKDSAGKPIRAATCRAAALLSYPTRDAVKQQYKCVPAPTAITLEGNCDDVPPPAPQVDEDGFTDVGTLSGHLCPGSDSRFELSVTRPVAVPFPKCWEVKPVVEFACDTEPPFLMDLDNDDPGQPWPIESAPPGEPGTPVDFL